MPLFTPIIPSSRPKACCFLRPKFTLLERGGGGGGEGGIKEEGNFTCIYFFFFFKIILPGSRV